MGNTTKANTVETGDHETKAHVGRLGRRETCIVNAAIMANSWGGKKRFNRPIVVDVDLPVWEEGVAEAR